MTAPKPSAATGFRSARFHGRAGMTGRAMKKRLKKLGKICLFLCALLLVGAAGLWVYLA